MWGTVGAVNTLGKVIERGKIDRKDVFHTLFPWATAGIVHAFQHPQKAKDLFFSPKKGPEISDNSPKKNNTKDHSNNRSKAGYRRYIKDVPLKASRFYLTVIKRYY